MTTCTRLREIEGKTHSFDSDSGWCLFGCGHRNDGRIVSTGGNEIRSARGDAPEPLEPPEPADDPEDLPPPLFDELEGNYA